MNSRSIFDLTVDAVLRRLPVWDRCDLCAVLITVQLCVDDVSLAVIRSAVAEQRALIRNDTDSHTYVASVIAFLAEATLTEIAKNSPAEFLAFHKIHHQPHGWPEFCPELRTVFVLLHLPRGRYPLELIASVVAQIDRLPAFARATPSISHSA